MFGVPSTSPNAAIFYPLVSSNITSQFLPSSTSANSLMPSIGSNLLLPPPPYSDNFLQQFLASNTPTLQLAMSPDIVRLAADTNAVSLAEDDEDLDQPLDLSLKKNVANNLS